MKATDLRALVNAHHDEIIEALREADRTAYKYTTCKYSVALYPGGHTERRERLAGDNWYYMNDPAVLEIGPFCYQYYDVLRDNLASDELLTLLETEMNETEKGPYFAYRAKYQEERQEWYEDNECYEPEDAEAIDWIEENLTDLWWRVMNAAIEELVTCQEAEDSREELLRLNIETYIQYHEDDLCETN